MNPHPNALPAYRDRGQEDPNVAAISPTDLDGIWRMLLQLLGAKSSATPALLQGAKLVGVEDGMAIVRFAHDHDAVVRMFDRNGKKDAIKEILTNLLQQNVGVRFELEPAPPEAPAQEQSQAEPRVAAARKVAPSASNGQVAPPAPEPPRLTPEMKEALRAEPLVAAVMQYLGGEIVKVE